MKNSVFLVFTILALTAKSQSKLVSEDSVIKKWELATVNIEATTSLFMEPSIQADFKKSLDKSTLSESEKQQQRIKLTENKLGMSGTAIFFKYENIHFLITARHVLEDSHFPQPGWPYNQIFFPENYNIVSGNFAPAFLYLMPLDTNLHVANFIFSPKDTDVAIVALDAYDYETGISNIPKILKERGYEPISIDDIDTIDRTHSGDLTYSIGFPELSMIGKKPSIDTFAIFQSNTVTLPVVSVGKAIMTRHATPYIISDVFVYHGNSGGPLIQNNKLVGIVHGPNLELRQLGGTRLKSYYFLNGNQFIKAKYILPLLRELVRRIKYNKSQLKSNH
jgi:hypothetical protein